MLKRMNTQSSYSNKVHEYRIMKKNMNAFNALYKQKLTKVIANLCLDVRCVMHLNPRTTVTFECSVVQIK